VWANKQPTSSLAQTTPDRSLPTRGLTSGTLGPIIFRHGESDVSQATGNPAQPDSGGGYVVSGCSALATSREWLSDLLHAVGKGILSYPLFQWLALNTGEEIAGLSAAEIPNRKHHHIGCRSYCLPNLFLRTSDIQPNLGPIVRRRGFVRRFGSK
jgi:hypothetical protein